MYEGPTTGNNKLFET